MQAFHTAKREGASTGQLWAAERRLVALLRLIGGICLLALASPWMPGSWIDADHR
jgi:hypothetical protein